MSVEGDMHYAHSIVTIKVGTKGIKGGKGAFGLIMTS